MASSYQNPKRILISYSSEYFYFGLQVCSWITTMIEDKQN